MGLNADQIERVGKLAVALQDVCVDQDITPEIGDKMSFYVAVGNGNTVGFSIVAEIDGPGDEGWHLELVL